MPHSTDTLALLGGAPLAKTPLTHAPWPPVSDVTADRLRAIYLSRQWSFNSPAEQTFAKDYAAYHDAKYGIFMANGTVTLQCALAACGVGAGDEVIVPALTWIATAMAANYINAIPVFVDIQPDTLCIDPKAIQAAITPKTKAIIPVHLYGSMADMQAILKIAKQHDLKVIEDCAHMQGGKWNGQGAGSWGDVGSFSFQQSKTVASGEGGICITSDPALAERIYRLKHIGCPSGMQQGEVAPGPPEGLLCNNFRGTAFQAVILSDQLVQLPQLIQRYHQNANLIRQRLNPLPGIRVQAPGRLATTQGAYGLCFFFDEEPTASIPIQTLHKALLAEGMGGLCLGTYGPVYRHHLFSMTSDQYRIAEAGCPVADAPNRIIMIFHPWLGEDEQTINHICDIFTKVVTHADALAQYKPENVPA